MSFHSLYRGSVYVALTLAALVFSAEGPSAGPLTLLYPAAVAVAGMFAWAVIDRGEGRGLPLVLANPLGFVALGLGYLEFNADRTNNLISALGHLLIYLQVIKIAQSKGPRDDWYLLALSLVIVLVGSYMGQGDLFGVLLFLWLVFSMLALMLGHLHREAQRAALLAGQVRSEAERADPYRGLMDAGFLIKTTRVGLATLFVGLSTFLLTPRFGGTGQAAPVPGVTQLSGFSDEVQLGRIGEILENDAVVMTIESHNAAGDRVRPAEETRWRGLSLVNYGQGRWRRLGREGGPSGFGPSLGDHVTSEDTTTIRHRIKLEPSRTQVLFAPRPVLRARVAGTSQGPRFSASDGTIWRGPTEMGYYEYEVWTLPGATEQPGESLPTSPGSIRDMFLALPGGTVPGRAAGPDLRARLELLSRRALVERGNPRETAERARALEAHLRDGGRYRYTLQLERGRTDLDPVEDFLINSKKGHCEYFASALTLLLRASGVPARLVNGFKGGDWNALANSTLVRQKHAHSWVEALIEDGPDGPYWLELDPTPPAEHRESVSQVGRSFLQLRLVSDFMRYVWVYYVVGFNAERQRRVLYTPVQQVISRAGEGYDLLIAMFKKAIAWLFDFPSYDSLFSWRGCLAAIVIMLLVAGALAAVRRALAWWRSWRDPEEGEEMSWPGAAFYRRLVQLLAESGLKREPAETPREFARRAGLFLSSRDGGQLADLPPEATDAYYGLRFGDIAPDPGTLADLEARTDVLERELGGKRSASTI